MIHVILKAINAHHNDDNNIFPDEVIISIYTPKGDIAISRKMTNGVRDTQVIIIGRTSLSVSINWPMVHMKYTSFHRNVIVRANVFFLTMSVQQSVAQTLRRRERYMYKGYLMYEHTSQTNMAK